MLYLIIFLGASYGATNIITGSKLFLPVRQYLLSSRHLVARKLGEVSVCAMCTGFWVGAFWYAALRATAWSCGFDFEWLAFACMASGFCWIVHVIMQRLGEAQL